MPKSNKSLDISYNDYAPHSSPLRGVAGDDDGQERDDNNVLNTNRVAEKGAVKDVDVVVSC